MELTSKERDWATAIKAAVETDTNLENLSDFEYAQHAIIAKEKVNKALIRIHHLQSFKRHYGIKGDGSLEQGVEFIKKLTENQPGMILSVGENSSGRQLHVSDYTAMIVKNLKTVDDWNAYFVGSFYQFQALQADIASIREGMSCVIQCKGMSWKNYSLELERRSAELYSDAYPIRLKRIWFLDLPAVVNVTYKIIEVFMSKKIRSVVQMTSTNSFLLEETTEKSFPKSALPTTLGGSCTELDMMMAVKAGLQKRYENMASFRL